MNHVPHASPSTVATGAVFNLGGEVEVFAAEPTAIHVTAATGGTEASDARIPTAPYDASTHTLLRREGTVVRDPCPRRS
jgi:hypothetical protein